MSHEVFIIAELGINHGGSVDIAKRLIDAAAEAGVNAVKFQTYSAEKRVSVSSPLFDILKRCELNIEAFQELQRHAQQLSVQFFSTPFDEKSVDDLEGIGCPLYKISSLDIGNHQLIAKAARTGKPLIMSVGMATLAEVREAFDLAKKYTQNITLLHCVSAYPTREEVANLAAIYTLKKNFDCVIGQSDHTSDIVVPLYAVAAGARVLEKHFKIDDKMDCIDAPVSISTIQMKQLVNEVRRLEKILGSDEVVPRSIEFGTMPYRRSSRMHST